jgi:hypothetical protein
MARRKPAKREIAAAKKMLRRLDEARAVLARPNGGAHSIEVRAATAVVAMTGPHERTLRQFAATEVG